MSDNRATFGKDHLPIIAAIPVFAGTETPDHYWLVCRTPNGFALAYAHSLTDEQWASGDYSADLGELLTRMYRNANVGHAAGLINGD